MVIARYQKTTKHWPVPAADYWRKTLIDSAIPPFTVCCPSVLCIDKRVYWGIYEGETLAAELGPHSVNLWFFFFFSELEMEGLPHPVARTVEEVFHDFKCRRAGLIKALTSGIDVCICVRRLYFLFFLDYGSERVACLCVYKHVLNYVVWRLICSCFVSYRGCCRSWEILSAVWSRWVFPFANGLW